jgi:hypothetical protein
MAPDATPEANPALCKDLLALLLDGAQFRAYDPFEIVDLDNHLIMHRMRGYGYFR